MNFQIKKIPFFDGTLAHVFFKNIGTANLQEFADSVDELFYSENLSPISVTVNGSKNAYKLWTKANQNTFDEINWITNWYNSPGNESAISGYFMAISQINLKSLVSDQFICKVFDTAEARFCFIGEVLAGENRTTLSEELSLVQNQLEKALKLCGLELDNLVSKTFLVSASDSSDIKELNVLKTGIFPPNQLVVASHHCKNRILGSALVIKPANSELRIETKKLEAVIGFKVENVHQIRVYNQNMEFIQLRNVSAFIESTDGQGSESQINQVMEAVSGWMETYELTWSQLLRGLTYFKEAGDAKTFKNICKDRKVPVANILTMCLESKSNIPLFNFELDFLKFELDFLKVK